MISNRLGILGVPVEGPGPWPLAGDVPRFRAALHHAGEPMTVAGAALDGDRESALGRCLAEGLERYAATVPRPPHAIGSTAELIGACFDVVPPDRLGGEVDPGTRIGWLAAEDGRLVPSNAALGHLSPYALRSGEGTYPHGSTGLAAGPEPAAARESAAAEVLERDVVARAWYDEAPLPVVELPATLRRLARRAGLEWSAHLLATTDPGSVVAFVGLRHRGRGVLGVGAAYRREAADGMAKAFTEAVVSLAQAAEVADLATGPALCERAAGLVPWRADRRYARGGWSHVGDIAGHVQLLLDPALQRAVWARMTVSHRSRPYRAARERRGQRAVDLLPGAATVDLTTPDLGGQAVCRVLAPDARVVRPAAHAPGELPCPLV